jgi:hypothetical protein
LCLHCNCHEKSCIRLINEMLKANFDSGLFNPRVSI